MNASFCKLAALGAIFLIGAQYSPGQTVPPAATPQAESPAPVPAAPVEAAPAAAAPAPAVAPAPEVKPSAVEIQAAPPPGGIQSGNNNTISISLEAVPVNQVVQMFARAANANIVSASLPATNVTVHLENVPWDAALRKILASVGLMLVKDEASAIYSVVSKDEMGAEPIKSEIIFLNYTTSSNLLPVIERMIIGLSNTTVAGFNGANAIVIRSPQSSLDQIKDVISKIDKQRDQVMIECKFVELNDQAIKDLGINWQSLQGWSVGIQTPRINLAKTTTKRNSINKDFKTQDVKVNTTVNQSQNASSSQSANGATALAGTSSSSVFNNTPPAPPTQTDLNSQNESTTGNSSASQAQSSSRNTSIISGNGFSDFDATSGKATIVPTANNLTENIDFGQKEIVNALSAVLSADTFQATLSALQQNDGIEVVSNPKIIVASGQTAQIHVGQNEPNIIQTQVPNGSSGFQTTFELDQRTPFIELGVLLNVTPVLNTSNNISLKLKPELTRKLSDKVVGSSGQTFPVTETRKVETEFSIESGRTVALGGLTQTTDREKVTKIPILGDIPIIGTYLFRHTHKEKIQDEIIIFVTASVAMPSGLAQVSGIPEEAKLIHRHLAKKVEEATKAEELAKKKAQKATLPK